MLEQGSHSAPSPLLWNRPIKARLWELLGWLQGSLAAQRQQLVMLALCQAQSEQLQDIVQWVIRLGVALVC